MSWICPSCGNEGSDEARFCFACGARLGGHPAATDARPARRERRLATALFADIVGSTALAEQEDPEVVQDVVGRVFDAAAIEIERHGGLVEKFIGDAILAVFGLPAVHEDDADRAVRAALAVQVATAALDTELVAAGRPPVALRIGIEGGEVLVDLDRADGPRHRMLTGDAVNTAARLEQVAAPGRVVVGPVAHATTAETIEYRALGPLPLKGKADPVQAWEAVGPRIAPHGQRAPLRLEAKLVGRGAEMAWLDRALLRVRAEAAPRLVTVLGPAGIGKSRLAYEFTQRLEADAEPVTVRRGRCLSYGSVSYSALAEMLKVESGVLDDDTPDAVAAKAAAAMERLFGSTELAPHLEALIGSGSDHPLGRDDLFDAWRRILERMAAPAPLVLVLEDLHWADDGLLDFVDHVAGWARGPILIVALARPELLERRPAWRYHDGEECALVLEPLTRPETEAMVESLLAGRLPPDLSATVLDAGEGNPLFCEEMVRMLVDRGVVRAGAGERWELGGGAGELEIPRTIQALLSARLDSLAGDEKTFLQDASVVGRMFWPAAVARLADLPEERVGSLLGGLETKGFVAPAASSTLSGMSEYAFRHVLIRDVAYESLPKAYRADKHVLTARWAEQQAGERSGEIAEVLATHHVQALRWLDELGEVDGRRREAEREGYRWSRAAGERARRLWQGREAVRWLRSALDLGRRVDRPDDDMAGLWESFARAADGVETHDEVARAWGEALGRYERLDRPADAGRAESWMAWSSIWAGQASEALRWAERAVERLERLGETADLAFALFVQGRHLLEHGQVDRAEPLLRRSMEIAGRVGDQPTRANAMIALGWALHARRRGDETVRLFDEALATARDAGELSLLLDALEAVLSAAVEVSGDGARAEALCREAIEVARRAGNLGKLGRAQLNLAYLLRELGRLDEVGEPALAGREAAIAVDDPTVIAWTHAVDALAFAVQGRVPDAQASFDAFRAVLGDVDFGSVPYVEESAGLVGAYIEMAQGRVVEAVRLLEEASRSVSDERLTVWFGQLLLFECARGQLLDGRRDEAIATRERLEWLAVANVPPRAFLAWTDGLLADDPVAAAAHLDEAAARLEGLGRRMDVGRCLLDVGRIEERLGGDGRATADRGRAILRSCGAELFLR
ncbi:MAG TPA: AAA family ATPase [Candidatus Limnocylindrales bacterium]|nr:AAA family ATPase [Candidatus Limnocylindrales bacterium]